MRRNELLLVGISILVTGALFFNNWRSNEELATAEFRRLTDDSVETMQLRMATYMQSLNATAAFLNSSEEVTRADFTNFVRQLEIEEFLPGINGIGVITPVQAGREARFEQQMRSLGEDRMVIHPETESKERYIINRIEPHEPNKEALGLDISFEQTRHDAVRAAIESGKPQLTGRILLVQEHSSEPGFLLLRPLFEQGADPETASFARFVYAPFVGRNLLNNLTANQGTIYQFQVFDGDTPAPQMLIYDSVGDGEAPNAEYTASYIFENYGRNWTVTYQSTKVFEAGFGNGMAYTILLAGVFLTAMLLFSMRSLRRRSEALNQLAQMRQRQISSREEENRAVIENAVTAVLILDGQRRILSANQAALNCFGYGARHIMGLHFDDLVTIIDPDRRSGGPNATGRTRGGEGLMLDVQCNDWLTGEGAPRVTAIVRDLTNEFEAREEIRVTKMRYDQALEGARIGVFDINLETGQSQVTETWCEIMGVDQGAGDFDPQAIFLSRVHPDDLEMLHKEDEDLKSGASERSIAEYRVEFPGGEWRWMRSDAVVVQRDRNGHAKRMIGTQVDITELRHSRNALEASEMRFRQVLAAAPIAMALMDDAGHFVGVNKAFCTLGDYSEDFLLSSARMSDLMPRDEVKKLALEIRKLMEDGQVHTYSAEHRVLNSSGFERWGMFHITWAFDKNKGTHYFIAQIIDITDQKKIDEVKNEFVATVSHELRTPLTSIKGALGLINASGAEKLSPGRQRLVEIALSNTERLTTIVNDILDLEKISSGGVSFDFDNMDMSMLIEDACQEMLPFAKTHHNTLRIDLPKDPLFVSADFSRTKQVLANLISNACKYSDPDTEVLIKAEALDGKAIVYVQNKGPGIPESFRPKMFQAFSQADSSDTRAKGGTGLGLNITKQIITRHEGEIGFESAPGGVTVFWFTYPLIDPKPEELAPIQRLEPFAKKHKARVLHLEEDADFAEVVRSGLQDVADVTHAATIEDAREILDRGDLDVVILDWALAEDASDQLLTAIGRKMPQARVLGLSSDADIHRDARVLANLEKSRMELSTLAGYVSGRIAKAS